MLRPLDLNPAAFIDDPGLCIEDWEVKGRCVMGRPGTKSYFQDPFISLY